MDDNAAAASVGDLCDLASHLVPGGTLAREVEAIRERLRQPLRIAIAGRARAGKSTLVNALLGERLAPTGGQGTPFVTWYREGVGYEVRAMLHDGTMRDLRFTRTTDAIDIDLARIPPDSIHHVDVVWPSSSLRDFVLIDTPGLTIPDDRPSQRARQFMTPERHMPSEADAIVYLMHYVHPADSALLDAFLDRSLAQASPVNAVAVLSRADEIGACRLDATESARRIALRYRTSSQLRTLCVSVVALAGLAAETGLTLREDEMKALRQLAAIDGDELSMMLLSTDRFCEWSWSPMVPELRRQLLRRFGLFGLRVAIALLRDERPTTASDMARKLIAVSSLGDLRSAIGEHFLPRASALKTRSALVSLRSVADSLGAYDAQGAARLDAEIEQVRASSRELAELRLLHLVLTGAAGFSPDEVGEVRRVTSPGPAALRVGHALDSDPQSVRDAIVAAIDRWRTKAADPLADPVQVGACETMAHSYETLYAAASTASG